LGKQSYPIVIGDGLMDKCGSFVRGIVGKKKAIILSSPKLYSLYGRRLNMTLRSQFGHVPVVLFEDREKNKNEKSLFFILRKLSEYGLQRDSLLITLGGGVIGDLGGLAASLYMRGIDFIQCPTTLLAQVDASVGGKTAIDFRGIKNLVGAFYQPKAVLIDPSVLKTLSPRQFNTGMAEVIKYGVISDARLFEFIETHAEKISNKGSLDYLIRRSCEIKAGIVSRDEKEKGERAFLNYGHTLGHALESYFGYDRLTHGEAIAYGMWFAGSLSVRLKLCTSDVLGRQVRLFRRMNLLRKIPWFNDKKVYEKMLLDKKSRRGKIQFILTRKIGLVTIQKNIPKPIILSALNQLQAEASESI
jgi:3-dehydroquinate synthase